MSEFSPPTARSELSGLKAILIRRFSCFRVKRHSAVFLWFYLPMLKSLTVISILKVTIKPRPVWLVDAAS
jgi:hypothetical protein